MKVRHQSSLIFIGILVLLSIHVNGENFGQSGINQRPIVGILSQTYGAMKDHTYVMGAYVKFVEEGGARAVPLFSDEPDEVTIEKLDKLNGVILPGGDMNLQNDDGSLTPYSTKGKVILDYVKEQNEKGSYYPLYAVCQGFEQVSVIEAPYKDTLLPVDATNHHFNLYLETNLSNTKFFKNMSKYLVDALQSKSIAMHSNGFRVDPKSFQTGNLSNYTVIATAKDGQGRQMVSAIEHVKYPIFSLQFHPEYNKYMWLPRLNIPHSKEARDLDRYFAEFFISETQKNFNHFGCYDEELSYLISNYPVIVTDGDLQDIYLFKPYLEMKFSLLKTQTFSPTCAPKTNVVFLLGGPGSGKSTTASKILPHIDYFLITASDLLRAEIAKGGPVADEITSYMEQGRIVPGWFITRLVLKAIEGHSNVIIDGYARNLDHLKEWEIQSADKAHVQFVLYLHADEETMINNVKKRIQKEVRADDSLDLLYARINVFKNETIPVIEHFKKLDKVCEVIASEKDHYQQTFADALNCFNH